LAARRLIAIVVEGKAEDDGHRFQFRAASHDLRDRRTLAHSPRNESGGRRYGTGWIRNREADAAIAVVDGQNAAEKREADRFAVLREEGRGRVAATLVYLTALLRRLFPIPFSLLPRREKLLIRPRPLHALQQELDGFGGRHVAQEIAQQVYAIQFFLRQQQFFLACARALNVDGGKHATVGDLAIEHELHVAGALELLEDHFVHARSRLDERRSDDRER